MATVYDRWFLTPAESTDEGVRPKYSDTDGITGFSGNTVEKSVVSDHYPALVYIYPNVSEWYIVRMYGKDNAGWNALNQIHNYQDTRTLADHAADVAPVLNDHFPEIDRTGTEWADLFKVN